MSDKNDLYKIDLRYIDFLQDQGVSVSNSEIAALNISEASDGDQVFEEDDVCSFFKLTQTREAQESCHVLFHNYRRDIINAFVLRNADLLLDKWPDFDLDTFSLVIEKAFCGQTNLAQTIDNLISHLTCQNMDKNTALVWGAVWLSLAGIKHTHEQWLDQGNFSALPEDDFDDFISTALHRFENGDITLGVLADQNTPDKHNLSRIVYLSLFDPENYSVNFSESVYQDPLLVFDKDNPLPFAAIVIHEVYHDYQLNVEGLDKSLFSAELGAEIISRKAALLMNNCSPVLTTNTEFLRNKFLEESRKTFLNGPYANSPLRFILESTTDLYSCHHEELTNTIALEELTTGKTLTEKRKQALILYSKQRLQGAIFTQMKQVIDKAFGPHLEEVADTGFSGSIQEVWKNNRQHIPPVKLETFSSMQQANKYLRNLIIIVCSAYYAGDQNEAKHLFETMLIPNFEMNFVSYYQNNYTFRDSVFSNK